MKALQAQAEKTKEETISQRINQKLVRNQVQSIFEKTRQSSAQADITESLRDVWKHADAGLGAILTGAEYGGAKTGQLQKAIEQALDNFMKNNAARGGKGVK